MTRGSRSRGVRVLFLKALPFAAFLGVFVGVVATGIAETPAQFVYRVSHSALGEFGTNATRVQRARNGVPVRRRAHFEVSMPGVRLYREEADGTNRCQANGLVRFLGSP